MPSERVQRRIDRLLDQAEEAADQHEWERVLTCVRAVLDADPENDDALVFKGMADAAAGSNSRGGDVSHVAPESAPFNPVEGEQSAGNAAQPTSFASGRYAVTRFLGEGGKKKVYLAHDNTLDRDVAFGLIKTEGLDETSRERVKREAQAMGRMGTHPCVMPIYDLGEEPDANGIAQPFMVQPLMGGGDVEGLIEDADGPLALEDALRIATQTAQGLVFAHSKGIVHRDLKPGNVWLDDNGDAKIGDFGLAVATDRSRLTVEKVMVGTVNYMPPEQATGGKVTPKADLYSLGAMLYEMCTGRVPFMADDEIGVISQHINTPPVAPSWHNSQIPKTLDALILRLMAKDPAERPSDADEVLAALKSVDLTAIEEREDGTGSLDSMAGGVFVGRHREMDQLKSIFEEVLSGKGRMVTLVGEPGIGKTRTAQELATYAGMRGAEVLWGRSYESGGAPPYWPWVQAIRAHVSATEPQALTSQLGSTASVIAEIVPDVKAKLPDLPEPTKIEDPESARFRLFDSISTFLKNVSVNQPLVVMLEDLHWSDKPSLLLLEFVARELSNSRILIVGNYRDMELNRRHPLSVTLGDLSRERLFERVVLRGLQKHDVQRFMEIAAGIAPPPALVDAVFKQTEGNPLFVTETVRLLIQEGDITAGQSSKGGTTSWEIRIPEGVREVIGRRLDRLSERCNEVLTIAAVIGRQFRFNVLKMLAEDTTDGQLLDAMDEALSARIIEELPDEVGFYQFTHAQMQETLSAELSANRRVRMHARIAEALEKHYGDKADEHAAELVEHFAEAETVLGTEQVIRYSIVAGERALDAPAPSQALIHFERALAAGGGDYESDSQVARLFHGLGRAQGNLSISAGESVAAVKTLQKAFAYYSSIGDQEKIASIALEPVVRRSAIGSREMIEAALAGVPPGGAPAGKLFARLVHHLALLGDFEAAADPQQQAFEIAKTLGDPSVEVEAQMSTYGLHCSMLTRANLELGITALDRAIELLATVQDSRALGLAHAWHSNASIRLGRADEALHHAEAGYEISSKIGLRVAINSCCAAAGHALLAKGHWVEAEIWENQRVSNLPNKESLGLLVRSQTEGIGSSDEFLRVLGTINPESTISTVAAYGMLAEICLRNPKLGLKPALRQAWGSARETYATASRIMLFGNPAISAGIVAIALGDRDLAEEAYERLEDGCGLEGGFSADRIRGQLAALLGNPRRAVDHFEEGLTFCGNGEFKREQAFLSHDYSELLISDGGDQGKITRLQDETVSLARELGMKPLLERVLARREILKA